MTKATSRTLILIVLVVLGLVGLFFALRPAPPSAGPEERAVDLEIRGDAMTPAEVALGEGDQANLRIIADRPIEFHLHGYDLEQEVLPGEPGELSFDADITGRFEIEDHNTDAVLGTLIVEPRQEG